MRNYGISALCWAGEVDDRRDSSQLSISFYPYSVVACAFGRSHRGRGMG